MLTFKPVSAMSDRKAALALYQGAPDYFRLTHQPAPTRATVTEDRLAKPADAPASAKHYGLLLENGVPVGVLDLLVGYPDAGTVYIGLLLLPASNQRRGLGRQAVAQLAAHFKDYARLRVAVVDDNKPAAAFWQAEGFVPVSATTTDLGDLNVVAVTIMDKALSEG
ncbi:GNAT family N-acetyltransferase [Lacticaseibacillus kribbianus]|uniref:GNAT family N-acetyltransferase n=1 Tax=Lacticaseibacillus kribbianus TaxID=2926292 RepID=UPI001CD1FB67|nr:GNAT family N-acetyltransferase [Lacticaseibacillus kribbianus]